MLHGSRWSKVNVHQHVLASGHMSVAPLSSIHEPPPEAATYMESMLGFRYPFTNGSSRVSNKGLRNPNRPSNIFIIRTNKFGIHMPIIISTKSIRGVSSSGKVLGDGITPFGHTTLIGLCHFLLRLLPFTNAAYFVEEEAFAFFFFLFFFFDE